MLVRDKALSIIYRYSLTYEAISDWIYILLSATA